MLKKSAPALLLGILLLAVPFAGMSQSPKGAEKGTTTVPVGGSATVESLIQRYTSLAGSEANATSLVNGLRSGSEITLTATVSVLVKNGCEKQVQQAVTITVMTPTGPRTMPVIDPATGQPKMQTITVKFDCYQSQEVKEAFTPPTGNMGLGNVDIALGFTSAQLVELGLSSPTPNQLRAALIGGDVEYGTATPKSTKTLPGILALRASGKGWGQIAGELGFKLQ